MKKGLFLLAILSVLCLVILAVKLGVTEKNDDSEVSGNPVVTEEPGIDFSYLSGSGYLFTSGAGGWGTVLYIEPDGSFFGEFHDSELGESGVDYDGSVYISKFNGTFSSLFKIDEKTYSMEVTSLTTENEPDTEEILDGVRYVYTLPYGVELGEEFKVHLPDIDVSEFSEEFKVTAQGSFYFEGDILPVVALETNVSQNGFNEIAVFTRQH